MDGDQSHKHNWMLSLVRMKLCEENWALGQASRNFTFKSQAEKDELEG